MRFLILSLVLAAALPLISCSGRPRRPDTRYSLPQAQEDFEELRRLIYKNHPMYFTDVDEMNTSFRSQYASLTDSMTVIEFRRAIAPAVALVRCGHTRLSFPEGIQESLRDTPHLLPFDIEVVRDTLLVLGSCVEDTDIPRGSIILSINDRSAQVIIDKILASLPADGYNETYKYFQMNQDFAKKYFACVEGADRLNMTFVTPHSADTMQTVVNAATSAEVRRLRQRNGPQGGPGAKTFYTTVKEEERYARLNMYFFGYDYSVDEFAHPIDSFFRTLNQQDIQYLILDLRRNDGGDPSPSARLLTYLVDRPFRYFSSGPMFSYSGLTNAQPLSENRFRGKLFVIVDGGCYSTTGHFCSILRTHGIGTFVGEETGGSYACHGGYREHSLRHTGVTLLLPHTTFIAAAQGLETGRGIRPDIEVRPSVSDVLNGTDPAMDTILALIRNQDTGQ